jgi:hypothetical protein
MVHRTMRGSLPINSLVTLAALALWAFVSGARERVRFMRSPPAKQVRVVAPSAADRLRWN